METGAKIFQRHTKHLASAVVHVLLTISATTAFAGGIAKALCLEGEKVFFSCELEGNGKTVSICTKLDSTPTTSTYRYGKKDHVELTFEASKNNKNRFFGNVLPARPNALVRQVWFDDKDMRYVLTECIGGDCPAHAGIIVLRKNVPLTSRRCLDKIGSQPAFSHSLVEFGSSVEDSSSRSDLLILDDIDNDTTSLYPPRLVN